MSLKEFGPIEKEKRCKFPLNHTLMKGQVNVRSLNRTAMRRHNIKGGKKEKYAEYVNVVLKRGDVCISVARTDF